MSIADSIANLIIQQGAIRGQQAQQVAEAQARAQVATAQAQAQAQQYGGQIWGQTIQNLGQLPMQAMQAYQQQKTAALEQQQRQLQITQLQRTMKGQDDANKVIASLPMTDDNLYDTAAVPQAFARANVPTDVTERYVTALDGINKATLNFRQDRRDHYAAVANSVLAAYKPGEPISVSGIQQGMAAMNRLDPQSITDADIQRMNTQLAQAPDGADLRPLLLGIRSQGTKWATQQPIKLGKDEQLRDPNDPSKVLAQGPREGFNLSPGQSRLEETTPGQPPTVVASVPPAPVKLAPSETLYGLPGQIGMPTLPGGIGTPGQPPPFPGAPPSMGQPPSGAPTALVTAPPKPGEVTASQEDARYEKILTARTLNQPVPPEDAAWATAYEKRKTLGPEASAAAAADRAGVVAQNQINAKGRDEYFTQVVKPYHQAQQSADSLRTIVNAAKAGNNIAGAFQNFQTTALDVHQNGFNRINTTELGVPAEAGSLWDRIEGRMNGLISGGSKKIPENLQNDMLRFADLMEKQSANRYRKDRQSILDTYTGVKLPDELGAPAGANPFRK